MISGSPLGTPTQRGQRSVIVGVRAARIERGETASMTAQQMSSLAASSSVGHDHLVLCRGLLSGDLRAASGQRWCHRGRREPPHRALAHHAREHVAIVRLAYADGPIAPHTASIAAVFRPTYPIETERLLLRPFEEGDLDWLVTLHGDPDVLRYLYWGPRTRAQLSFKLERTAIEREGDALNLAAVVRETGEPVADMSLFWTSEQHDQGEVGYLVDPRQQGRGYATEAARALLRVGFEELSFHRIAARLDGRNTASAQVCERLGMRREAQLVENERVKGEWVSEVVYGMLAREWRAA